MDSENLYRVQREDLPKLEKLLNLCFAHDPLYETLIPNAEIRKKLMPELFHCDMDEFYETCEIFSDSEELNGVLVVSDETKSCNIFRFLYTEAKAVLHTDSFLIKLHIILIVCLQRDHHPVLICVAYGFLQKSCRNPMMLHLRINCQIDHVEPAILMKLVCPVRIQIVSALDKIVKRMQRRIFFYQKTIRM